MKIIYSILATALAAATITSAMADASDNKGKPMRLWYKQPAKKWAGEALPIGNGRMGGMIFGGIEEEHVQFNVDSLWTGDENPGGDYGHTHMGDYQTFGDIFIQLGGTRLQPAEIDVGGKAASDVKNTEYTRDLDLSKALSTVTYTKNGITYKRETFCSNPDDVMVMRLTADKPNALSGKIKLVDSRKNTTKAEGSTLAFSSSLSNGMLYEARLRLLNKNGTVSAESGSLAFNGCDSITLLLAADTDYKPDYTTGWRGENPHNRLVRLLNSAAKKDYAKLKSDHIKDHRSLFNRLSISLGETPTEAMQLPTDKRIARYKKTHDDRNLEAMLFQYGRYLLIGCSRPGTLPANLQGLWNNSNKPPWHADYHSNINMQMNYWLSEPANLPQLAEPLFDMLVAGAPVYHKHTVKKYGADTKGYVTRMSINPFGGSGWHWNIEGTAWLAQHFWEHYAFSMDKAFLEKTAWPWLRDVSLFWLANLKELPDGQLVAPNVWSHEHGPYEDGTAHAQQLMWDLFSNTLAAARLLDKDKELQLRLETTIGKLYGPHIGSWGQLMEWMGEKPNLEKSHHRHTSHLFAVYPGHQISREKTPEFAKGAELSLLTRGSTGDSRRSWTWPWRCALWARFGKPEKCHEMIQGLFQYNMLNNMFATHPPFQMDGNFGITAGMCEMLLQSQTDRIVMLPALPQAWKDGSVKGIRARGGYTLDMTWKDGKLTSFNIKASVKGRCKLQYGDKIITLKLKAGQNRSYNL